MLPSELFRHCPKCGQARLSQTQPSPFQCHQCGFTYYFGPTAAAAAILERTDGKALVIRRARNPASGKIGLPGGFLEIGETAEEGLRREVLEEVGITLDHLEFLGSEPNLYHYAGVTYPVLDFYFKAFVPANQIVVALDDVAAFEWITPSDLPLDEIAFPSTRAIWLKTYPRSVT
ncbi:MAG: NUDIX domain-containing protein [Verrucomicrobiota bacterium]|nr:NUDIX domain-containing protein [Verrucomicrobiota bacterium]